MSDPLDALEAALRDERQALLEQDVGNLLESTRAKLAVLKDIESTDLGATSHERLVELDTLNRANGTLLVRRRREVNWALKQLGMVEPKATYGADGAAKARLPAARYFGKV